MPLRSTRRGFLRTAGAASLGLGGLEPFLALSPATAQEAKVTPELVRLSPDIEPIVRLIEATPREKCVEVMAEQLRKGLPYRQFLAALFLAGIRNFKPADSGAMHQVYLMHSAHQLSLDARPEERLLPLFFALDNFAAYRESEEKSGAREPLHPLRGRLPAGDQALDEFRAAMDDWDGERADRAIVALARSRGVNAVAEALWPYAARDFMHVGHKAIFAANAWQTLETIGWQHAEPVLRSLALSLVSYRMQYAEPKEAYRTRFEKQPYLPNVERVQKAADRLPGDWAVADSDAGSTRELLSLLREGHTEDACRLAASQLVEGKVRAGSIWDAVHLAAGELMLRRPNLASVHAVTSANALHYAFGMSGRAETRLLVLLQAVGWMGEFRNRFPNGLQDVRITELTPAEIPASEEAAAREILAAPKPLTAEAARRAFHYAQLHPEPEVFFREARRLVILKADEEHEYKFPAAIFEDYRLVSPRWRPHMLGVSVYYLRGAGLPDSPVIQRVREAVGAR